MNKNTFQTVKLAKGEMNVYDFGGVKLHAYKTNDLIDDEVFIVELLSKLIPDRARRELRRRKVDTKVETVKRSATGYTIELRGEKIDEYLFSSDGRLLGMRD